MTQISNVKFKCQMKSLNFKFENGNNGYFLKFGHLALI
jgi:hypothetical protein